jgi:hypothetical protein
MTLWLVALAALFLQSNGAVVSGTVTNGETRAPVANAELVLVPADTTPAASIATRADTLGQFRFTNVPAGSYRLVAEHNGYLRGALPQAIVIASDRGQEELSIALTPTGVITGRVIDAAGDPSPGIDVRALTAADVTIDLSTTDDRGEYRLFGLAPGNYVVSASAYRPPRVEGSQYIVPTRPCSTCPGEGQFMQRLSNLLASGAFVDPRALASEAFPTVYYPGTTDRAAAQPVSVRAGVDMSGIDLQLVARSGRGF